MEKQDVPGDGHCILHSACCGSDLTMDGLKEALMHEVMTNTHLYQPFVTGDVQCQILDYIYNKKYNQEAVDIVVYVLFAEQLWYWVRDGKYFFDKKL